MSIKSIVLTSNDPNYLKEIISSAKPDNQTKKYAEFRLDGIYIEQILANSNIVKLYRTYLSAIPDSLSSNYALEKIAQVASEDNNLDELYDVFEDAKKRRHDNVAKIAQKRIFSMRKFPFDFEVSCTKNSNLFLFEWRVSKMTSEEDLIKIRKDYLDPKYKDVVSKRLASLKN